MSNGLPTTLIGAIRYFSDQDVCVEYVAKLRWPDGPTCPRCDSPAYSYLRTRRVWKCAVCKKQYSVKVGTIFEDSPIGLDKWLAAIWLIANSKNGVSSHGLARAVGVTQKSAWFMSHRIRLAMQIGAFEGLDGMVELERQGPQDHQYGRDGQDHRDRCPLGEDYSHATVQHAERASTVRFARTEPRTSGVW